MIASLNMGITILKPIKNLGTWEKLTWDNANNKKAVINCQK